MTIGDILCAMKLGELCRLYHAQMSRTKLTNCISQN